MDYNHLEPSDGGLKLIGVRNFKPKHIFECGQCFRWDMVNEGRYLGVVRGKVLEVSEEDTGILLHNVNEEDFRSIFEDYFDLKREYGPIKDELSKDPLLKESVEFGHGIRILNQEPFETLISFIISANNGIPRIKAAVAKISEKWGTPISYNGSTYYAFPSPLQLSKASEADLRGIGIGFRAKYVHRTVMAVYEAECLERESLTRKLSDDEALSLEQSLDRIASLPHRLCHNALQCFDGVGPKVADCIMLFSMGKQEAFPVDVWVKKAMSFFYKAPEMSLPKTREFGQDKFGSLSGFAQQYLFYNARENKVKVE